MSIGSVKVVKERCEGCFFDAEEKTWLDRDRFHEALDEVLRKRGSVGCPHAVESAVCRVYYDRHGEQNPIIRLGKKLGVVKEIDIKEGS